VIAARLSIGRAANVAATNPAARTPSRQVKSGGGDGGGAVCACATEELTSKAPVQTARDSQCLLTIERDFT
jgi:hypothetical protein